MGILSWTDKIFLPKSVPKDFTFDKYLHALNSGKFLNRFVFGVLENTGDILSVNMKNSANALYVGSMGSGKSKAAVFSIFTWMFANSEQSLLFIVDPMKGANDYAALFEQDSKNRPVYKQVYTILSSEQGVKLLIDLLYDEAMARREKFNEVQAESFEDYEKKTGKNIARVLTLMEEFHAIPYAIMNFYPDFKTELTTANKFHTLMRIGRSYGIWFIACTQKSTKSDIPPEMAPNFVNKNVFRVNRGEATYLLGDTKAAEITPEQKGRCITEYGPAQFPLFDSDTERKLLKKYVKPLKAECFYLNNDIILDVLSGKSKKDQYKHKKLTDLIKGVESYNAELVITLLHEKQGHTVEPLDSKIDNFGISHIVHWNNDIKVAVMSRCQANAKKITGKHIGRLKKAMDSNECTHGIIYTSATDLPNNLYKVANELGIEVVDHEDMFKAAYKVEAEGEKAGLTPDHLADDGKESGEYQLSHHNRHHVSDDDDYATGGMDESDFMPHQMPTIDEDDDSGIDLHQYEQDRLEKKEQATNKKVKNIGRLLGDDDDSSMEDEFGDDESIDEIKQEAMHELDETVEEAQEEVLEEMKHESFDLDPSRVVVPKPKSKEPVAEIIKMKTSPPIQQTQAPAPSSESVSDILLTAKPVSRAVKREKVTRLCTIRKEDTPSLLMHVMKTEENQVFRVLFFILDNMQIKHKYYIDKKIEGNLTFKEKQFLGVATTEEWNSQKEVLDQENFDKEFLNYLENFAPCAFPVHSICWQADEDFISKYLRQCDFMIRSSTIIEKHTSAFFNNRESRLELIQKMGIKKPKLGLFNPIESDLEIWRATN